MPKETKLRPPKHPCHLTFRKMSTVDDSWLEMGVDEAGRGCLLGRVYAAAVVLDPSVPLHMYLNDSKKVSEKRRKLVREWIEDTALFWDVAYCDVDVIASVNILNAAMLAMKTAMTDLSFPVNVVLVDGNCLPLKVLHVQDQEIPVENMIKGDATNASIAAASILAKEYRDEYIRELCKDEPDLQEKYNLLSNMGYSGTETHKHNAGLLRYGPSKHHRLSFLKRILPDLHPAPSILDVKDDSDDD